MGDGRSSVPEEVSNLSGWWTSIGETIEERWSASGRHAEGFPELAAGVLRDFPAPGGPLALPALSWVASAELPHQHDLGSGFGQPAVTVFRGEGFIVYLLFWFHETISIHDHRFDGAFTIVEGRSLQHVYEFGAEERISMGIEAGTLRCTAIETLGPGDVRLIPRGSGLVHSNFHYAHPTPTLSLVARTLVKAEDPQHIYSHGGLAFVGDERSPDTAMRLHGFTAACRISPDAGIAYLTRVLAHAEPEEVIAFVTTAARYFGSALCLDPFIEKSALGRSDRACRLLVLHARQVHQSLTALGELAGLVEEHDRLLMSMVAAGTDWEMATGVLNQVVPGASARGALCTLVSGLVERTRSSERPSLCTLSDAAMSSVRARASESADTKAAPPAEVDYTELVTHRVFGSLFRFVLGDEAD